MTIPKIISFSGKKHCGKSELCRVSEEYGYININFADELKFLICRCLKITKNELEKNKDFKYKYKLNEEHINIIIQELLLNEEHINIIQELLLDKEFNSIREILQFIGTDVIRAFNPSWHIKKIKDKINPIKKYVIGDTRFLDEKKWLKNLMDSVGILLEKKI